mmetsp:Transcript_38256/g.87577  ORF Transcript_38256/g.87577 Transcript_38256/m.87577 type:complete len:333 (-) Transcript_38256:22-1020(-)
MLRLGQLLPRRWPSLSHAPLAAARRLLTTAATEPPLIHTNALPRAGHMRHWPTPQLHLPFEIGPLACNKTRDNEGAHQRDQRVGRGIGSGRGRKCGRGQKGRKARPGNQGLVWRAGGQAPMWKRVPKSGFYRPRLHYKEMNVGQLQAHVNSGRLVLPAGRPLNVKDLFDAKLITLRQKYSGVKLLGGGKGRVTSPIRIEVQDVTPNAVAAIERAGGAVETVYYSRLTLRALLKPEKYVRRGQLRPRPALPPPRLMRNLYATEEKRGYLRNLKEGDVVRPEEQPLHVDLDLRLPGGPRYPRFHMANYQRDLRAAEAAAAAAAAGAYFPSSSEF